jgi:hypothetical protein
VTAQQFGQQPDQCREHCPIGPIQACFGVVTAEYGDLVAQDEQLDILGRRRVA